LGASGDLEPLDFNPAVVVDVIGFRVFKLGLMVDPVQNQGHKF
jgi:hypothetical protein